MSLTGRTLAAAVVDSSALMCILLGESAAPFFMAGLQATGLLYIGAATRAETWLAAFNAKGKAGAKQIEALLDALQVETVAFTQAALPHYFDGAELHHHKVDPKAKFNLGDLFTYALVKETGLPLFFQGTDFANTSIVNAMEKLGYEMLKKGVLQPARENK